MTSRAPGSLALAQQPWLHRRVVGGCALSVALLFAGWAYLKVAHSQSAQPHLDSPVAWISRPVLSNNNLSSGAEVVFRPEFNKTTGQGSLFANRINDSGAVQATSPWTNADAGVLLKSQHPFNDRRIFTRSGDPQKNGVPFLWADLSVTQQNALGGSKAGPSILSFLRGDASNEKSAKGDFRDRSTPLGAIVHSNLVRWAHSPGGQRLYVGANDGMLHAFDAATGRELFAYVPSMLIPRLKVLTDPKYEPQAFVDGPLVIGNVNDGGAVKTLLVGGLGAGGKGLFALDVSASTFDSDTAAAQTLKWEISPDSNGFVNLGYTYAAPSLVRLEGGRAAVVVGNGYGSSSGKATLLLIDALTGELIKEIATPVGYVGSPNGLSSPTLADRNGDGKVDTAYAGDLQGNLWRFDLSEDTEDTAPEKLFTTSPSQAITTAPALRRHPVRGQLVIFGTGKALIDADLRDTSAHAVYGIWDEAPEANEKLLEQSVTEVLYNNDKAQRWRTTTTNPINWSDQATTPLHKGWKLSLPAGERLLGESPFIEGNRFVFTSMNPTKAPVDNFGPGENWMTQVSVFNGGNVDSPILDVNGDTKINGSDNVSGQILNGRFIANGVVSQPVLVDSSGLSKTLYNYNPEIGLSGIVKSTIEEKVFTPNGVLNGHFDVDIYYNYKAGEYSHGKNVHTHKYDDVYNVIGVNFLAPSKGEFNVTNAINAATQFKVLVVNQYLNPASLLRVGPDAAYVRVKDFQGQASATNSSFVDALPTFSPSNMKNFVWKVPVNGFDIDDWWGDGGTYRPGLIPTNTGCVNKGYKSNLGPNGEIYNGALTLQLIKPETPPEALELNHQVGGAKYGWRVKSTSRQYVLAEYTLFWHHNSTGCYHESTWKPNPGADLGSTEGKKTSVSGSSDPTATAVGEPVTEVHRVVTVSGDVTTTMISFSDGSKLQITEKVVVSDKEQKARWRDGTEVPESGGSVDVIGCNGTAGGATCSGASQPGFPDGRFNWRELRAND